MRLSEEPEASKKRERIWGFIIMKTGIQNDRRQGRNMGWRAGNKRRRRK